MVPDLSICNEMYVGDISDKLKELTVVEEAMLARQRAKACILHLKESADKPEIRNGPQSNGAKNPDTQRGVRGHFIIFPSYPERVT